MFKSAAVSVTSTATAIYTFAAENVSLLVQNLGTADCYLGGSGVTTSIGVKLASGDSVQVAGSVGEVLYGRTTSGTADVRILKEAV